MESPLLFSVEAGLLDPMQLDRQELYDIFQDDAFALFVDKHMKYLFQEPCAIHSVCSPIKCDTPTYVREEHEEEVVVGKDESKQPTCLVPQSPCKSSKRIPINKWGKLPKFSYTNKLRRTQTHKIIWSGTLQQRFLHALELLGLDEAMPSDILYIMNVDGLTRPNIASHLQKYRQRVALQERKV